MNKSLKISKLDAAKRQLETAIRLYFSEGDPVSIHTLAAAAYDVIHDITAKRGAEPMLLKDRMLDYVKPEYKKMLGEKLNAAANFFKHADRDPEATLDFNPDMSELHILDACSQYRRLTGEFPPLFQIYQTWVMAKHPDMYILTEEVKRIISAPSFPAMGRAGYFNTMLPLVMRIRA